MILYHYTTEARYKKIIYENEFKPSNNTLTDAVCGPGWYFTDLTTNTCEKILMKFCWEDPNLYQRTKYYLKFEIFNIYVNWVKKHVYFVKINSPARFFNLVDGGPTPECLLKPCYSCEENPENYPEKYRDIFQ